MRPKAVGAVHLRSVMACLVMLGAPAWTACESDAPGDGPRESAGQPGGLQVWMAALANCTPNGNADNDFPEAFDRVVIRLSGGPLGDDIVRTFSPDDASATGEILVPDIPPGAGMQLEVVGCDDDGPTWFGEARDVEVIEGDKVTPSLFMTPVGAVACVGTPQHPDARTLGSPRAYATAAAAKGGAWILGGFATFDDQARQLGASAGADWYHREESYFETRGGLVGPRAMAWSEVTPEGKVRLAGGVTGALVLATGEAPIWARPDQAPSCAVELFDPATGESACEQDGAIAALPSVVRVGSQILAVGGVGEGAGNGVPSDEVVVFDDDGGKRVATMPQPRFGASVVELPGGRALIWGGNADGTPDDVALLFSKEDEAPVPLQVQTDEIVPFLASALVVGPGPGSSTLVLLVGGADVGESGFALSVGSARAQLLTVDVSGGFATITNLELPAEMSNAFARAAGSLRGQTDGSFVWLSGFNAFTQNKPVCGNEQVCFPDEVFHFRLNTNDPPSLQIVGSPLELSVGAFGATAVRLEDASYLVSGGLAGVSGDQAIDEGAAIVRLEAPAGGLCQ